MRIINKRKNKTQRGLNQQVCFGTYFLCNALEAYALQLERMILGLLQKPATEERV